MSTLTEIEAAVEILPPEQKRKLLDFLTQQLQASVTPPLASRRTKQEVLQAIEASPLRFSNTWDQLRAETHG